MNPYLITDAATEPLTLGQARLALKEDPDITARDAMISDWIVAARKDAEQRTGGLSLTTQTWELALDAFPPREIELGRPAVVSITSVKYIDPAVVEQTLNPAAYVLDRTTAPGWLLPAAGTSWPATYAGSVSTVKVRYSTGYLADADKERALLRQWMRARLQFYDRGADGEWTEHLDRMLDSYRYRAGLA